MSISDDISECIQGVEYSKIKWEKNPKHIEDFLLSYFGGINKKLEKLLNHLKKEINHTETISIHIDTNKGRYADNYDEYEGGHGHYFLDIYRAPGLGVFFHKALNETPDPRNIDSNYIKIDHSTLIEFPYSYNNSFSSSFAAKTLTLNSKITAKVIEPLEPVIVDIFKKDSNFCTKVKTMCEELSKPLRAQVIVGIYGNEDFFVIKNLSVEIYPR